MDNFKFIVDKWIKNCGKVVDKLSTLWIICGKLEKVFKNNMLDYRYQNPVISYLKPYDIVLKTTCKSSQNQKKQDKILFLSPASSPGL